ncbi:hypothetical protein F4604DRAFT_1919728 [Suillus subluteus]|nr:hypothetical protein F4604DRAFT_1919728 [Suillus subluteus]
MTRAHFPPPVPASCSLASPNRTFPCSLNTQLINAQCLSEQYTKVHCVLQFQFHLRHSNSASVPLRSSSLRRSSTPTLASSCDMHVDPEGHGENLFKTAESRRSRVYPDAAIVGVKVKKVPTQPDTSSTPSTKNPKTPPSKPRVLPTVIKAATPIKQPKFRKGHMSSLSVSCDEEEKARSQRAKKPRTREPPWSLIAFSDPHARQTLPVLAPTQFTTTSSVRKDLTRKHESGRSTFSSSKASSRPSDNDNEFSTASVEATATSVSLSTPVVPVPKVKPKPKEMEEPKTTTTTTKPKPIRHNLMGNPSMFGPELPCPQATPSPPSHIPLSSPIGSPVTASPSTPATPLLATQTRPPTLRRAARKISSCFIWRERDGGAWDTLFANFFPFILFASTPHFDLSPISSAYLVPAHPFAPDQYFYFPILKGRPHSLIHSPSCLIMHACTLLRSSL